MAQIVPPNNLEGIEETFEANAFEALEKDFQEVLQELVGDKSLEHFRQEYEKLHRALKGSHENEKRLIKKCRELNAEIVSNAIKVQTALKLSQEDHSTITALQKEIERAWKMVEGSHEKEQRAKDAISVLKSEISNLSHLVEHGAGMSINQEKTLNNLQTQKNDLMKHRDMLQSQVSQLQSQHNAYEKKVAKLESEKSATTKTLEQLKDDLQVKKNVVENEARCKDKLDSELKELREALENKQADIELKRDEIEEWRKQCIEWHEKVKVERANVEKKSQDEAQLEATILGVKGQIENEVFTRVKLRDDLIEKNKNNESLTDEHKKIKKERDKLTRDIVDLKKVKEDIIKESKSVDDSKKKYKHLLLESSMELEQLKMVGDHDLKQLTTLKHERDILHKSMVKSDENTKYHVGLVKQREGEVNTTQKEVQRWKFNLHKILKRIVELEKQREKSQNELLISHNKNINCLEDIKYKDNILLEYLKQITDIKSKLNQQKNLFEAVRSDRNVYSKNLLESQEEIIEMRKKFKIMIRQIEQMKEEIKEKDQGLIKKHCDLHRLQKELEKIKDSLDKAERRQQNVVKVVDSQRDEIKILEETIQETEVERQNQNKEYETLRGERNILSTQLMQRNEELRLLYEKIKIQSSTLEKGETQYTLRCQELRVLGQKHIQLVQQVEQTSTYAQNVEELKKELYQVQKDLLQERTKVKALGEELENPMNVHRWRKLEGSNPQTFTLINKIRTLQNRLINKTQDCINMEEVIRKKEKDYIDCKYILARQPGPEIIETLEVYKEQHAFKKKQLHAMTSELGSYSQQVNDYRDESDRLNRELLDVKKKYFNQKKREHLERDLGRGDTKVIHTIPKQQRYTGGGFNLSI